MIPRISWRKACTLQKITVGIFKMQKPFGVTQQRAKEWEFCDLPLCSAGQWLPRNGRMFWWLALHTFKTTMNCEQNSVRYINLVN